MTASRELSNLRLLSRTELDTRANGMKPVERETERECRSGQMVLSTKVIGEMIRLTEEVVLFMLMVMCMKETGRMIRHTVLESTCTLTVLSTKVNGRKTSSMERARRPGLMEHATRETM